MIVTNKIKVDLARRGMTEVINAVQTDAYSRNVEITLLSDGVPWAVPDGSTILVSYLKPDGTKGIYDTLPDNSAAGSVSGNAGNILTVAIAPQVLTAPGNVLFSVQLTNGETVLNVFPMEIHVEAQPGFGGVSEDYYNTQSLPSVTQEDNGKVLTVVDGIWKAEESKGGALAEAGGETVSSISVTEAADGAVTMVNTFASGGTETIVIGADENGNPNSLTYNGQAIPFEWVVSE